MVAEATSFATVPAELLIPGEAGPLLTRDQLVERIQRVNPTATSGRLDGFDSSALRLYLSHLLAKREPRDRSNAWLRPGDTPAILTREPRD